MNQIQTANKITCSNWSDYCWHYFWYSATGTERVDLFLDVTSHNLCARGATKGFYMEIEKKEWQIVTPFSLCKTYRSLHKEWQFVTLIQCNRDIHLSQDNWPILCFKRSNNLSLIMKVLVEKFISEGNFIHYYMVESFRVEFLQVSLNSANINRYNLPNNDLRSL
jgi:hypothetical protein